MTPTLSAFIEQHTRRIDQQLAQSLPHLSAGGERLLAAMRYSLLQGGKRIRPILAYAGAAAVGEITTCTDRAASALECIHAYSLIHDDLPVMDDDDLRRGEPTCHIAFDEATAVLAGDALQSLAFELLTDATDTGSSGYNAYTALALVRELGKAAGARGMVLGQAIDLGAVSQQLSLEQLEHMHSHKTGALIEASVVMGAISGGVPTDGQLTCLRTYAQAIGLAFQVQDDILDVTAATAVLGKRQGADQQRNKPTYTTLLGLEAAQAKAFELRDQALLALQEFDDKADHLRHLADYIVERGS